MSARITVALATANPGKAREIAAIFVGASFDIVPADTFGWRPPQEGETSYLENALLKARSLATISGMPAIADDSGIEADALDGAPGMLSARYAGEDATDEANVDTLLAALGDVPDAQRRGRFRCVAVCVTPDGRSVNAEATVEGTIITERRGSNGFGYDPIFMPDDHTLTTAQLDPKEKDAISHRGKAFRALAPRMQDLLAQR